MQSDDTQRDTLRRAIAGDRVAQDGLLIEHHDRLIAWISNKLPADRRRDGFAEEVAQEAYVVAFRELRTFDPGETGAGFFAWLARIAEHRMLDMLKGLRAIKRGGGRASVKDPVAGERDSDMIGLLDLLTVHSRTPSRSAARSEAVAAVEAAMEAIDLDYRTALRLRYIDGLSISDVAARLDRSEGSVLMLCNRGLKQLREILGDSSRFLTRKS